MRNQVDGCDLAHLPGNPMCQPTPWCERASPMRLWMSLAVLGRRENSKEKEFYHNNLVAPGPEMYS
jgi:hypothetical protein